MVSSVFVCKKPARLEWAAGGFLKLLYFDEHQNKKLRGGAGPLNPVKAESLYLRDGKLSKVSDTAVEKPLVNDRDLLHCVSEWFLQAFR
jgi:hypothetical protein